MTDKKRFVVGLDPLVSGTSMALFRDGDLDPLTQWIESPTPSRDFSVYANSKRIKEHADSVVVGITENGDPELVVMAKPVCGDQKRDPTGVRRMMLVGEIEQRLIDADIPVAEMPSMSVVKWVLGGNYTYPPRDFDKVEAEIRSRWVLPKELPEKFRLTTIALAGAGATVMGISTRLPVTNAGLHTLGTTMTLPPRWRLPETEPQWRKKFQAPADAA